MAALLLEAAAGDGDCDGQSLKSEIKTIDAKKQAQKQDTQKDDANADDQDGEPSKKKAKKGQGQKAKQTAVISIN